MVLYVFESNLLNIFQYTKKIITLHDLGTLICHHHDQKRGETFGEIFASLLNLTGVLIPQPEKIDQKLVKNRSNIGQNSVENGSHFGL